MIVFTNLNRALEGNENPYITIALLVILCILLGFVSWIIVDEIKTHIRSHEDSKRNRKRG